MQPARPDAPFRFRQQLSRLGQDLKTGRKIEPLPVRVAEVIAARADASEVLIKLIQLVVVILFGVLYALARKTDAGTTFTPVPYVLAGYFAATLFGLFWASRARLPDWAVYFSIFLDMSLLMTMILSFHIQYQQPPAFVLKAPSLLYVFIFIALRALRFEPRFVIAAGVMGAAGWGAMILYVLKSSPAEDIITRSYVEYLTGNVILLGAEFDKIISILVVTFIIALALGRAHRLLVDAVCERTAVRDLSRFFDSGVVTRIRGSRSEITPGSSVKRTAAVLNVDIRGFTQLTATMDPGDVMGLLADYQSRIVQIVQERNGTIDKFIGDGIMATFGAVSESGTFAADALAAADRIIDETRDWSAARSKIGRSVEVNVSVISGPLLFGVVGGRERLEYTVIGSVVNMCAKLEKHNKALNSRSLTTKETFDLARRQGYRPGRRCGHVTSAIPGVDDPVEIVVLKS